MEEFVIFLRKEAKFAIRSSLSTIDMSTDLRKRNVQSQSSETNDAVDSSKKKSIEGKGQKYLLET